MHRFTENIMRQVLLTLVFQLCIMLYPMIILTDSKGPDQTARMRRLIWAFTVRICPKTRFRMARLIYMIIKNIYMINKDSYMINKKCYSLINYIFTTI